MAGAAFIAIHIRLHPAEFGPQTIARPSGVTLLGMVAKPLRVGIVGAGFAGCSAALNLAQRGVSVTLLEAAPKPGPVGLGIGLRSPSA